jgi:hypothetical protein
MKAINFSFKHAQFFFYCKKHAKNRRIFFKSTDKMLYVGPIVGQLRHGKHFVLCMA